jgi:elongation factor Tu
LVVFLNKVRSWWMTLSCWSWLRVEIRELLSKSTNSLAMTIPIISGSALAALAGKVHPEIGETKIRKIAGRLMDSYIPQPERPKDKPFLMPVEDVFSISGRGTVATGRIEQGVVNVGDES